MARRDELSGRLRKRDFGQTAEPRDDLE